MKLVVKQGTRRVVVDSSKVKAVGTGPFNLAPRGVEVVIAIGADDVVVEYAEGGVDVLKMADAAAAEALVDRIAAAVGVMVEPLAKGPEVVTETVMFDGSEVIEAPRNPNWSGRKASEWVPGEPPKDGEVYQVEHTDPRRMGSRSYARWVNRHWFRCDGGVLGEITAWFRVTCEPESVAPKPASEWVDGEPPKDGRWYVAHRGSPEMPITVMGGMGTYHDANGGERTGLVAYLPTPIPP